MLIVACTTAWAHWSTIDILVNRWQWSMDYSAGQLVPLVALFFVWRERKTLTWHSMVPCWSGGLALVLLAQSLRLFALFFGIGSGDPYTLVLTIAGLLLMVAGREIFRRLLWVLLFLFLMVPLPTPVHNVIAGPLQRLATTGSVFLLEAFGTRVTQQGNVVMLGDNTPMAVAEACSGLRMLTAFIIVAAFIAYMVKRPRWQKGIVLASSIPIAVICNIIRISLTAMIMLYVSVELGEKFFHDFAGLVMMPAAVSLIFSEIWLMDRLIVPDSESRSGRDSGSTRPAGGVVVRKRTSTS
ncbi:MAG: exosortase/archaeosortase family protein [Phycisphaerae bacterium]|nr:exosortase/archaeosortase family protein [Phycisphaerae bacterium]